MGLFKKEACAVCGGKTGMLDHKIMDGKICKECNSKLSPWFEDYKSKNAGNIEKQISARETEQQIIPHLNFNKVFGDRGVIFIDDEAEKFVCIGDTSTSLFGAQKKVTCIEDVLEFKPDLLSISDITGMELDITVTSREEKYTEDGEQRSYDPPHILYMCTFYLEILLDHPYVKRCRISLNDDAIHIKNEGRRVWTDPGRRLAAHLLDMPGLIIENQEAFYNNDSLIDFFYHSPYEMPDYSYGFRCSPRNIDGIRQYHYYLFMAQEIMRALHWEEK